MVRRIVVIACIGAVLVFVAASAQAAVVVNQTFDIDLSVFVPCAGGGAGEIVDLSGPLHDMFTFTINNNNVSGFTHDNPQGISGLGESTGDTYHGVGVTQSHFSGSLTNGQFNVTSINNFRIIGQGPGNNFMVHENTHITINANGEITTVIDNFSVTCH